MARVAKWLSLSPATLLGSSLLLSSLRIHRKYGTIPLAKQ